MTPAPIAALPMYDFPGLAGETDALWQAIAARLVAAGVAGVPAALERSLGHLATWQHPGLLLGQACEYPLATRYGAAVYVLATPRYRAEGCEGARYRSALVVRRDDPARHLRELAGRRCAINEPDSNSGMNLLRAAVAPLAGGRPFFSGVSLTGAHRASAAAVSAGEADVAAIDCVTWAHLTRFEPEIAGRLRILDWTPASPALPLITARNTDPATRRALTAALADVARDPGLAGVRAALLLDGFDLAPDRDFRRVRELADAASALGYTELPPRAL